MATTSKTLVTAERFMEMGLGPGSFELVKGEVIEVSPGNYSHGIVCACDRLHPATLRQTI